MSKVKIQGNASGTGVLTITAPNTSTDRTITLPDTTGTLLDENSSVPAANLTGTIATARLGTGSAGSGNFLRGDGSWQTAGSTSASDLTSGTLSSARLPAGSIIQVVHATDIVATAIASTSYTDIGLSASITPQTNSKVLIIADLQTHLASGNYGYWVQLMRDSTAASSNVATDPSVSYYDNSGSTDVRQQSTFTFLDSSVGGNGSTSITYKIQAKTVAGRSVAFSASEAPAMITLMEIKG